VARRPRRIAIGLRDAVADREEQLRVLGETREIPGREHLALRLVVAPLAGPLAGLEAEAGRLADVVDAGVGVERRHADLGEVEVIRAVVEALLQLGIGLYNV